MIEGELVNLRAMEMSDVDRCTRWMNDPDVTRYLSRRRYPYPSAAVESWLRERCGAPMRFHGEVWFAVDAKDGRHIGTCDLAASAEDRKAMLGVMIGERDCWDQGYGTDAVRTLTRFAFEEMNLHRVALTVFDANARAQTAYRACGYVEEGRLRQAMYRRGVYHDHVQMSVLREEFYARERAAEPEVPR